MRPCYSKLTGLILNASSSGDIVPSIFNYSSTVRHHHLNRSFHSLNDNNNHWSILNIIDRREYKKVGKYACYLLNVSDASFKFFEPHKQVWDDADHRVAVDGSANCLHKRKLLHTADIICGDFDSIDIRLLEQLRCPKTNPDIANKKGNPSSAPTKVPLVIETPSQKETDFTKALRVVHQKRPDIQSSFGLYYSDGSRIDHLFGLINTLHLIKGHIILLNLRTNTVSWLLPPGKHFIHKPKGSELCSLVPFTGPTSVSTKGLEYDLSSKNVLSFGVLISTSNICWAESTSISIETDKELLWSIDINSKHER